MTKQTTHTTHTLETSRITNQTKITSHTPLFYNVKCIRRDKRNKTAPINYKHTHIKTYKYIKLEHINQNVKRIKLAQSVYTRACESKKLIG